jgi:uncharacterized coiled-coil protein SlyX
MISFSSLEENSPDEIGEITLDLKLVQKTLKFLKRKVSSMEKEIQRNSDQIQLLIQKYDESNSNSQSQPNHSFYENFFDTISSLKIVFIIIILISIYIWVKNFFSPRRRLFGIF